jgi:hypothetical protein
MMNKFVDIACPCIWVVPEVTTKVVPSLVHLHHAKLTVWTPRPQHRLLRCVASNITHRSEVTLAFQWEIGFEIFWLLMPQLKLKPCSSPLHEDIVQCCEMKEIEWMVLHIGRRRRLAGWWALRSVGKETKQWLGENTP